MSCFHMTGDQVAPQKNWYQLSNSRFGASRRQTYYWRVDISSFTKITIYYSYHGSGKTFLHRVTGV